MRLSLLIGSLAIASLIGCGGTQRPAPLTQGEERGVGVYVSSTYAFETNAFVIDAPDGAILVGTTLTPREALQAKAYAEEITGKVLTLAIVLHPTHDQFNGTNALRAEEVRVISSAQVTSRSADAFAGPSFAERFQPDWPDEPPALAPFGADTTELEVAGTTLRLHVLGAGTSAAHVVVEWQGHVFAGNLVTNGHHGAIDADLVDSWRARLDDIAALNPNRVHPSRGASGDVVLLSRQREYLDEVVRIVRTAIPELPIVDEAIPKIVERVEARFPEHHSLELLRQSLPSLYTVLSTRPRGPISD